MPKTTTRTKLGAIAALISVTFPVLKKGEHYAGIALKDGKPTHHLVLLPGELGCETFDAAGKWVKKQGGDLPTRQEQSLLFANCKDQFQPAYYWSGEQRASDSAYAWSQGFNNGLQLYWRKDGKSRVRAVRRVPIQ